MLTVVAWVVGVAAALYGLHRLALWMEKRGWIYYKTSGSGSAAGNAFLAVQALLEPAKVHVVEARIAEESRVEDAESGAPPELDDGG